VTEPVPDEADDDTGRRVDAGLSAGHVVIALAVLAGVAALLLFWPHAPSTPGDRSAEAGFARDMQVHHDQAVQMAFMIRDKATDPTLRTIAYDIITTQQQQSGQMAAWLQVWGLPATGTQPPMAWMAGHPGHGAVTSAMSTSTTAPGRAAMPGMATPDQLAELERAQGPAAERLFLQLMIAHHRGGIVMADAVLSSTEQPQVRRLATAIASSQRAEIEQMTELLDRIPAG
jgi:uncharacterized protein (DUF305 family)